MNYEKKLKILVAEDNQINIQVAKYILNPIVSLIDFALDGEDAVGFFLKNEYDLILMDIKMPVLDGIEATQKIRQIEVSQNNGSRIPIIAMTASNDCDEARSCLDAGMDGFLSKPFSAEDFRNVLKTIDLELQQQ